MNILLQLVIGLFIADAATSIFHWFEDTYLPFCTTGIFGRIARDNHMHHYFPRAIVYHSYWHSSRFTVPGAMVILMLWYLIWPSSFQAYPFLVGSAVFWGASSNICHKFSHMRDCECPIIIRLLQRVGLLISHEHHRQHHANATEKYAIISPFTNYVLDPIGFWRGMEFIISLFTGIKPSRNSSYDDYMKKVKKTELHVDSKNTCPRKLKSTDIAFLDDVLSKHYSCPA